MPFKFSHVCDLLERLEDYATRDPPFLAQRFEAVNRTAVEQWFSAHRARIGASGVPHAALLSSFFPERRTDRVYGLREKSLVKLLGRVLCLPYTRAHHLYEWDKAGSGGLGGCIEKVQKQAEMPVPFPSQEVTVEEVDLALAALARRCRFSSPAVRRADAVSEDAVPEKVLTPIYRRLQSRDAKWMTRLLLKDFSPVVIPERLFLREYHFLLPELLQFQCSFDAVSTLLDDPILGKLPSKPKGKDEEKSARKAAAAALVPRVGVKVGRVDFWKARSIKHCVQMAAGRLMSMQRKYDGEYCQVHIDLAKGRDCIQIFSKSGKDSTTDRRKVVNTIRDSLRIGQSDCRISEKCILEGELVVYCDELRQIVDFHRLRRHLPRSGTYFGVGADSPPQPSEYLMIVFFDIMLIDNKLAGSRNHGERMDRLKDTVKIIPGRAELAWQMAIDFSQPDAERDLKQAFSRGIASRWEGFVLKASHQTFFPLEDSSVPGRASWIKLKKDYIAGLGDTADFAIVGAGFNLHHVQRSKGKGQIKRKVNGKDLRWTHYHIGCLENKEDVSRFGARPMFRVIATVSFWMNQSEKEDMDVLGQQHAVPIDGEDEQEFDLKFESGLECKMDVVFQTPYVFEVMGGGFDKPADKPFYWLRWPRVVKVHWDRTFIDTISFRELQNLADEARNVSFDDDSREERRWMRKLSRRGKGSEKDDVDDETESEERQTTSGSDTSDSTDEDSESPGQTIHPPSPPCNSMPAHAVDSDSTASDEIEEPIKIYDGKPQKRGAEDEVTISPPPRKRANIYQKCASLLEELASTSSDEDSTEQAVKTHPLTDITNVSPGRKSLRPSAQRPILPQPPPKSQTSTGTRLEVRSAPVIRSRSDMDSNLGRSAKLPDRHQSSSTTIKFHEDSKRTFTFGKCAKSPSCSLKETLVILSPCLAGMPYITKDLLPGHGTPFTLEAPDLMSSSLLATVQRVALVESHRSNATAEFMRGVIACTNEDVEISFYDWRLLESLAKDEKGQKVGFDPWEKWLIAKL
ncbi:MAG: hypothetical protein M1825_005822 [Sarcosagium campestre]|nr:MAG: hypothetical protein M1825_005822 [Sarcosagium campestre]